MLKALLGCWATVSNFAQRLEHGALKEDDAVTAKDGRELVFPNAQVMFEISRTPRGRSDA